MWCADGHGKCREPAIGTSDENGLVDVQNVHQPFKIFRINQGTVVAVFQAIGVWMTVAPAVADAIEVQTKRFPLRLPGSPVPHGAVNEHESWTCSFPDIVQHDIRSEGDWLRRQFVQAHRTILSSMTSNGQITHSSVDTDPTRLVTYGL